ncbi:hypothetical protein P168DRAFT_293826 [Aspergillus campestris IBT 28561]|uniref:PHD and RING finger domain protein n=1 Tax=Aspergillus campestris (strain IBT 28561) TaxID=1392248 RepID=A0A2I1CQQ0_ASPC2|nr:uncharacterized protein P168DRAFT_293826 [Aspergillus campestris IBT 28561]PKX99948.1 hypothetical protein P168DRAFT_293826 [Aspergillus campestris IBT 28561]
MSDTCIVCLGDLGEGASDPRAVVPVPAPRPDLAVDGKSSVPSFKADDVDGSEDAGQIAQLLPCGHILHNNCLKPWVERANSCPICRRSFNLVELSERLGGPVLSSYAVQDRVQVAEVDPSMIMEFVEDDLAEHQPCPVCGDADNEELLLLCDRCDAPYHTYCVDLDEVPPGPWYCARCEAQRASGPAPLATDSAARPQERRGRRTRAQQRRMQNRSQLNSLHWAQVWQSVWDHLNIDLDFPFDDDRAAERVRQQQRREQANQREFRAWQRRFEVAERQGAPHRFRDAAALLDIEAPRPSRPRAPREPTPEPESLEEMRAWNAFERAREIENEPGPSRKRKEPTMSPSPEPAEPQRKLKRPRTRRAQDLAVLASQNGESSRAAGAQVSARINAEPSTEPSFLQSLLKEVEDSRAISPMRLSSPVDSPSPPFSPDVSPSGSRQRSRGSPPLPTDGARRRAPRPASRLFAGRANDSSPTRPGLALEVKSDIQKLVGTALKPYYRSKIISKPEYTEINRTISRKFYERVGDVETLDPEARANLERSAKDEVDQAVDAARQAKQQSDGIVSADDNTS